MNGADKLIEKIQRNYFPSLTENFPVITSTALSVDKSEKLLFQYNDGISVEAVIMPYGKKFTLCLSTQAGCAMGCTFCMSGDNGLQRSLNAEEIVAQYLLCYKRILERYPDNVIPFPSIVIMGEGEPLSNFDNVKEALDIFSQREGVSLGAKQITLSTMGFLPGVKRIAELPDINIAISFHSPIHQKRRELIPMEKKYPIKEIIDILKDRYRNQRYITMEYLLVDSFNDGEEDISAIKSFLHDLDYTLNIIPLNYIEDKKWFSPDVDKIEWFRNRLLFHEIPFRIRQSRGQDIMAACGQLKGIR